MKMKMPDNSIGGSSANNFTVTNISGYYSDSFDSDPDGFDTPPNEDNSNGPSEDFAEYMWMENEEEFDMEEMKRLEEEELMEQCMEAMMQDEVAREEGTGTATSQESGLLNILTSLQIAKEQQQPQQSSAVAEKSTLNPLAAEFVPSLRSLVVPGSY